MTQYGYEPLSPEDSGSTLLDRVNGVVPALLTNHKGAARPAYVQPGMLWVDDSGATWLLNLFDGTNDVSIAVVDPAKHSAVDTNVPLTRKLKVGSGLSIDGVSGDDDQPAVGDLTGDRLLKLVSLSLEAWKAGTATTAAPISPVILAAAVKALAGGALPKGIVEISVSGGYKPSAGTKFILGIMRGAGGSGAGNQSGSGGGGGGEGALALPLIRVNEAATYTVTIGAGGPSRPGGNNGIAGGDTSIVVDGVTYAAGGGLGGYTYGVGGAGGVPSATCALGFCGASGGGNYNGTSAWRQAGSAFGQGGGASQAPGSPGSATGGAGYVGHMTILEFGS